MRNYYIKEMDRIGHINFSLARELLGKGLLIAGAKSLKAEIESAEEKVCRLRSLLEQVEADRDTELEAIREKL